MSEKIAKSNLFSSAKKREKKESKGDTLSLDVSPELQKQLNDYTEAKEQFKTWEGKKKIAEGEIKSHAIELYLRECKSQKRHIGSFKLGPVTVSVQDRYATLDDNVAQVLVQNFPDIIVTSTEYSFDQAILKKYINEISEALQNSGIPEQDLEALILANEVTSVKKGAIDTLASYGDKMPDLFNAISPVISFR